MCKLNRMILVLFIVSVLIPVLAQKKDTGRIRGLYVKKKADGLNISVMRNDNGKFVLVDPGHEFRAGDEIRVQFRSNFTGIVYFVNVTPGGVSRVIYHHKIKANEINDLPADPDVITLNNETGIEILKLIMSRQIVPAFEKALKKSDGDLADNGTTAGSMPSAENVGIVQPDNKSEMRCRGLELALGSGIRCRGLELAPGNEQKGEGAVVVAIPEDKGNIRQSARLKAGEVAVLEIRLKHVR